MPRIDKDQSVNYLDYVPSRAIEHEIGDNGRYVLLRPKFMRGILARFLQPHINSKHFKVRLDDFGSKTWASINGRRTVAEIADMLYEEFGDTIEPRYERCSKFLNSLHQGAMITLELKQRVSEE
ncbi:MAG: PqqD family protein [Deltaproteobacteria bacterium]|nr:PqqD family protein [Deltaproteobacteria bacterium]